MELLAIDCDILISTYCVATLSHHAHAGVRVWLRKTCFSIRIYAHKRTTARDIKVEEWYTYSGKLSRIAPVQLFRCGPRACATHPCTRNADIRISQNFAENTFADGIETAKNAKVYSLESFPRCGSTYVHTRTQAIYILRYTRTPRSILPGIDISALYNYIIIHGRSKSGIFEKKIGTPGHSLFFRYNPGKSGMVGRYAHSSCKASPSQ